MTDGSLLKLSHRYVPNPRHRPPALHAAERLGLFLFGFPQNRFGSIEASKNCNLRCRHCYFYEFDGGEERGELAIEQWMERLDELSRTTSRLQLPLLQCSWIGGEPLLRKKLIEQGRRYFRFNTVVTNGTIPLPDWPDVNWYISIDGDEETHERIRRKKGIYQKALRNVREHPNLRVTIAMCIMRDNVHCVESVCKEWLEAGAVGVTFDFLTPAIGAEDPMWLRPDERDRVIDVLLELKRIYRGFIVIDERTLRLMYSKTAKAVTDHCLFPKKAFAFDAEGKPKEKCMMGPNADCDRCGCVVPYYLASLTNRKLIVQDLGRGASRLGRRIAVL